MLRGLRPIRKRFRRDLWPVCRACCRRFVSRRGARFFIGFDAAGAAPILLMSSCRPDTQTFLSSLKISFGMPSGSSIVLYAS